MTGPSGLPRRPPAVWVGDAARVLVRLRAVAGTDVAARVLVLLGLRAAPSAASKGPAVTPDQEGIRPPGWPFVDSGPAVTTPPTVREALRGQPPATRAEDAAVPLVERVPPDPARAIAAPRHLPALADVLDSPVAAAPPGSADLLPTGQQRAILSALCRSPAATGDIDVEELVERIARREPVRRLPLRAVPTTRRGVQVLVDFGEGMRPFVRDQRDVVRALERLAGPDGFDVLRFAGTPLDPPGAGPGPVWTWRPYRPPLAGQPVVVLSDLGAGAGHPHRPAVTAHWMAFAAQLRAAGNQMVALVPVPATRIPAELRAAVPVLVWDRTTRVADAVQATRRCAGRVQGRSR